MNALSFAVLRALSDGGFHSGAALARSLEVTRGTIWNAVSALEQAGLTVYRVRGRGYRLSEPVSVLDRERVLSHCADVAGRVDVEIQEVLDSTNTHLAQRAAAGARGGTVVAAEVQTAGRGRLGRPWHSELSGALTFSLLWRFTEGAGALAGLSLAAGVALVRTLEDLGARDVRLKWPNDILWHGAKLGGILIEMQGDALGPSAAVIGVGMNVSLSASARGEIDQPATDLASVCGKQLDRNAVLGVTLRQLVGVLDVFSERGFAALKAEWERVHAHQGCEIVLTFPNGRTERGIARGVGDDGSLLFEYEGAVRHVHSGEVSLRELGRPGGSAPPARVRRSA